MAHSTWTWSSHPMESRRSPMRGDAAWRWKDFRSAIPTSLRASRQPTESKIARRCRACGRFSSIGPPSGHNDAAHRDGDLDRRRKRLDTELLRVRLDDNATETLADYGLKPLKARATRTSEQKAKAAAKVRATRKARGTTSKKQKASVHGMVTTTEPSAAPPTPPKPAT